MLPPPLIPILFKLKIFDTFPETNELDDILFISPSDTVKISAISHR